jgi:branched-subunit amino acid transport protein AzlD
MPAEPAHLDTATVLWTIAGVGAVTFALRGLPFLMPASVLDNRHLRQAAGFMPLVIMTILVVNAFRHVSLAAPLSVLPVAGGVAVTILLQVARRNVFLSIIGGVLCHIALRHLL